jgi:hypothetical protein
MKRIISLLLVFSVLSLSMPLTAKKRRGANLIVQKTDGTQRRGELIAVKQNSLLLLDRYFGNDVTVNIADISTVRIERKSLAREGAFLGFFIGAGSGIIIGVKEGKKDKEEAGEKAFLLSWLFDFSFVVYGLLFGLGGLIIGGILGKLASTDTNIKFEGKTDVEIKAMLEKLRKKARIKNAQ